MKKNKISIGLILCLTMVLAAGCKNAEYDAITNGIYLKEAFSSKGPTSRKITVDNENVELALTPILSSAMPSDLTAEFSLDQSALDAYNAANKTTYEMLPAKFYELPAKITIPAGKVSIEASKIILKPYTAENGAQYALPLSIVSPEIQSLPTSSKYIVLLDKPLIQSVPYMNYKSHLKCEPLDDAGELKRNWGLSLSQWTLEFWVWMDGYKINNQALFDSDDIYIRFGDAPIAYDLLQIKLRGTQVNTATHFKVSTWTHVAFTYDTEGLLTIYINGVKDVTLQTKGGAMPVNYLQMVSSGVTYFRNNCQMAQIRFWNKSLSGTQIDGNRFYSLKPTDDMVGYWRMDDGEGDICKDCTPNKRHAHASAPLTWNHDIRFDGK